MTTAATSQSFVPQRGKGDVLITSRESVFQELGIARALDVRDLDSDEAVRFLLTRTGREDDEPARTHRRDRTGRGARESSARTRAGRGLHCGNQRRLLRLSSVVPQTSRHAAGESRRTRVARHRRRHVGGELRGGRDARRLPPPTCCESVPSSHPTRSRLRSSPKERRSLGGPIAAALSDPDELAMAELLRPLARYSLIRSDAALRAFGVHRLVQEIVRAAIGESERRTYVERAVAAPRRGVSRGRVRDAGRSAIGSFRTSCRLPDGLTRTTCTPTRAGRILNQTGRYLSERGRYTEAEPLHERALAIRERALGPDHPDVAMPASTTSRSSIGIRAGTPKPSRCTSARWRFGNAHSGPDHPDVATQPQQPRGRSI